MSCSRVSVNPFQAPRTWDPISPMQSGELAVPFGQYRIYDSQLLISGDVQLPAVCVRTGVTEHLVSRVAEVEFVDRRGLLLLMIPGTILGLMVAFVLVASIAVAHLAQHPYPFTVVLSIVAALLLGYTLLTRVLRDHRNGVVKIRYFESFDWRADRNRQNGLFWLIFVAAAILTFAYVWLWFDTPVVFPIMLCIVAGGLDARFVAARQFGGHIFAISGIPTNFLTESAWGDQQAVSQCDPEMSVVDSPRWESHF